MVGKKQYWLTVVLMTLGLIILLGTSYTNYEFSYEIAEDYVDQTEAYDNYVKVIEELTINPELPYAGAFIDDQGTLNIGLVDNSKVQQNMIKSSTRVDNVKFYSAQYSYVQLSDLQKQIESSLDDIEKEMGQLITIIYIDEVDNSLVIGVEKLDEKVQRVINNFKFESINAIKYIEEPIAQEHNWLNRYRPLRGGLQVANINTHYGGWRGHSLGFSARRSNGDVGVVVSGHGVDNLNREVFQPSNSTNNRIGIVTVDPQGPSTRNSDAAFVKTGSGVTVIGRIHGGGSTIYDIVSHSFNPPIGYDIAQYGKTTGRTTGKILKKNVTRTFNKQYKYNKNILGNGRMYSLVEASYSSQSGDSGGPITNINNSPPYNSLTLLGMHVGAGGGKAYYSPIQNIMNDLGVTPLRASEGSRRN